MRTKKIICVGIISILLLIITTCLTIKIIQKSNKKVANTDIKNTINEELLQKENATNQISNVISENTLASNNESIENIDTLSKNEVDYETITLSTNKKINPTQSNNEKSITESKATSSNPQVVQQSNNEKTDIVKPPTQVTGETSLHIKAMPEEKNNNVTEQEQPKQETKPEQPKQEEKPKETPKETPKVETKDEELYVRNDAMINQIRQVIESNASENMITYGYEIVVDSSIKGLTNQFTYTENRVKNAIINKFGTIRIYAEDYYRNGQLIMTECYII